MAGLGGVVLEEPGSGRSRKRKFLEYQEREVLKNATCGRKFDVEVWRGEEEGGYDKEVMPWEGRGHRGYALSVRLICGLRSFVESRNSLMTGSI